MTRIEFIIVTSTTLILDRVIKEIQARYWNWKFNRDYRNSVKRMKTCKHTRSNRVNIGSEECPQYAEKCQDCWALRMEMSYMNEKGEFRTQKVWTPNSAKP